MGSGAKFKPFPVNLARRLASALLNPSIFSCWRKVT